MNSVLTHIRILRGLFLIIVIVCIGTYSGKSFNVNIALFLLIYISTYSCITRYIIT